jgi:hypothetical protein
MRGGRVTPTKNIFSRFSSRDLKRRREHRVSPAASINMKNDLSFKLVAAAILAGVILAFTQPAHAATAAPAKKTRTKERSGTYQGSNGSSGTFDATTVRAKGDVQRNSTLTNQDGKTATRSAERTWDKTTGTGTVSTSTTRLDGKTESREGTLTKNVDGSIAGEGTITGANGKIANYTTTTSKTENGATTTGTITGPNGKTTSYASTTSKTGAGEISRDTTVTGPNGKSSEKIVSTKLNGDGTGTRTIEVTKPDGTTETRSETFTVTTTP